MEPETNATRPGTPKSGGLAHTSSPRDEVYREPAQLPDVPGVYQYCMYIKSVVQFLVLIQL